jgi:hypothetical protein
MKSTYKQMFEQARVQLEEQTSLTRFWIKETFKLLAIWKTHTTAYWIWIIPVTVIVLTNMFFLDNIFIRAFNWGVVICIWLRIFEQLFIHIKYIKQQKNGA